MTDSRSTKSNAVQLPVGTMARALAVAFGPSAVLDALCMLATAIVVRRSTGRARGPLNPVIALLTGLLAAFPWVYLGLLRPWHRRLGASPEEQRAALPLDELVPEPGYQHTRAITIHAPIDHVWKWLVQIGQGRGGFYSYDWLENLAGCDIHSADRVHQEWQSLAVGDTLAVIRGWGPKVLAVNPGRSLTIEGWGTYLLEPIDQYSTRLIARARQPRGRGVVAYALFVEIPHFIMERKMLMGLRDRAERSASSTALDQILPEYEFAGTVSTTIRATPGAIFKALRQVTLAEMPIAHALGYIRYLPGRITGRTKIDPEERTRPFFDVVAPGVLVDEPEREVVIGSVGRLHDMLDQKIVKFEDIETFKRFHDPEYEKHAESFRIIGGSAETGYTLLAEHRTQALGTPARWKFSIYWYVMISWASNLLLRMLLEAVRKRAERHPV